MPLRRALGGLVVLAGAATAGALCTGQPPTPHMQWADSDTCLRNGRGAIDKHTCDAVCEDGYQPHSQSGKTENTFKCDGAKNSWSYKPGMSGRDKIDCVQNGPPPPPPPQSFCKGTSQPPNPSMVWKYTSGPHTCGPDDHDQGAECPAACDKAKGLVPADPTKPESRFRCTCGASCSWVEEPGGASCRDKPEVTCPEMAPGALVQHASGCDELPADYTCTVYCDDGYTRHGSNEYTCGADGQWGGGALSCTEPPPPPPAPAGHCDAVPPTEHARNCTAGVWQLGGPNTRCPVVCLPGYVAADGARTVTCGSEGQWVGNAGTCRRTCWFPANSTGRDPGSTGAGPLCANSSDGTPHFLKCISDHRDHGNADGRCQCQYPWWGVNCEHNFSKPCECPDTATLVNRTCIFELKTGSYGEDPTEYKTACKGGIVARSDQSPDGSTDLDDAVVVVMIGAIVLLLALLALGCYRCGQRRSDGGEGEQDPHGSPGHCCSLGEVAWVLLTVAATCGVVVLLLRHPERTDSSQPAWDILCAAWATAACGAGWPIVRSGRAQLRGLRGSACPLTGAGFTEQQREALTHTGLAGLAMFGFGVVDLVQDGWLMAEVWELPTGAAGPLLYAVVSSTLATSAISLTLGFSLLTEIRGRSNAAEAWMLSHSQLASAVVFASISRIESISVLRLRPCGRDVSLLSLPMEPKYFFFIQHLGAYHLLVEDIPHILVAVAKHQELGEWTTVDALTVALGAISCGQMAVRWLLWLGRRDLSKGHEQDAAGQLRTSLLLQSPAPATTAAPATAEAAEAAMAGRMVAPPPPTF
jgi:hypothetical protein